MRQGHRQRSAAIGKVRSDILRAAFACAVLGAVIGLALFAGLGQQTAPAAQANRIANTSAERNSKLTTGSVVFVPILGDRCYRRVIDNATWRIRDDGEVDCATALYPDAVAGTQWATARIDVIRDSFRNK
jgi:hypothetical protein